MVNDGEAANLDLPFAVVLNFRQKSGQEKSCSPRRHDLGQRCDGLNGGIPNAGCLVGEAVADEQRKDLLKDEWLDGVAASLVAKGLNQSASAFAGNGVLLVGERFFDGLCQPQSCESTGPLDLFCMETKYQPGARCLAHSAGFKKI